MLLYAFYSVSSFFFPSLIVQLDVPVESDQSFSEQASLGNTSHSTVLSTDASLQEEKAEDTESSSAAVGTQEPSATGLNSDFFVIILMLFLSQLRAGPSCS